MLSYFVFASFCSHSSVSLSQVFELALVGCCNRNQEKRLTKKRKILPSSSTVLTSDSLSSLFFFFFFLYSHPFQFVCLCAVIFYALCNWRLLSPDSVDADAHFSSSSHRPVAAAAAESNLTQLYDFPCPLSWYQSCYRKEEKAPLNFFFFFFFFFFIFFFLLFAVSLFKGNSSEIPSPVTFYQTTQRHHYLNIRSKLRANSICTGGGKQVAVTSHLTSRHPHPGVNPHPLSFLLSLSLSLFYFHSHPPSQP